MEKVIMVLFELSLGLVKAHRFAAAAVPRSVFPHLGRACLRAVATLTKLVLQLSQGTSMHWVLLRDYRTRNLM